MSCLFFHSWEDEHVWIPSSKAKIVEFYYFQRECRDCGKKEILSIYDDRKHRPEAYDSNNKLIE